MAHAKPHPPHGQHQQVMSILMNKSLLRFGALSLASGIAWAADRAAPQEPAEISSITRSAELGGQREDFRIGTKQNRAFVILPSQRAADGTLPWIWYAPTFLEGKWRLPDKSHDWLLSQLVSQGFAVCGVDVGDSFGSPAGRAGFTEFYRAVVKHYKLSTKACLLPQSRGGLMFYNWAAEHPDWVQCIGGIYPVGDLSSWPGLAKACATYGMSESELRKHLAEHNPIDRLAPLAQAKIPILHLHGDADKLVPLDRNSGELARRYRALGGQMELVVIPDRGHEVVPEFFHNQQLVDFFCLLGRERTARTSPRRPLHRSDKHGTKSKAAPRTGEHSAVPLKSARAAATAGSSHRALLRSSISIAIPAPRYCQHP